MAKKKSSSRFLLCIKNDDYPASLEVRKVYRRLPDVQATKRGYTRVIDESGEDYLCPHEYFVPIELPQAAATAFAEAS